MRAEDAEAIRRTVLHALAQDRTPGWSFTGYFQGVDWPVIGDDSMTVTMPAGRHATDAQGNVEASALLGLIDAAMASPLRIKLPPGARMATTQISVQFTGAKVRSSVRVETRKEGRTQSSAMPQLLAHARLYGDAGLAMIGQSSFVQLPPPQQMGEMAPCRGSGMNASKCHRLARRSSIPVNVRYLRPAKRRWWRMWRTQPYRSCGISGASCRREPQAVLSVGWQWGRILQTASGMFRVAS